MAENEKFKLAGETMSCMKIGRRLAFSNANSWWNWKLTADPPSPTTPHPSFVVSLAVVKQQVRVCRTEEKMWQCLCSVQSVCYLIVTFTYQQTKSWARIGRRERGVCQLFHTKMKKKQLSVCLSFSYFQTCYKNMSIPGLKHYDT